MPVFTLDEATLAGGVQWLYGLQEQADATRASDVAGGGGRPRLSLSQTGSGGVAEFGTAGIMPEGTAVRFDAESSGGLTLGASTVEAYLSGGWTVFLVFARGSASGSVNLATFGSSTTQRVRISATATAVAARITNSAGAATTVVHAKSVGDNRPHFVAVVGGRSAGTFHLHVDDEFTSGAGDDPGRVAGLTIGDAGTTIAHQVAWVGHAVEAMSAARVGELALMGYGGAERSDLRVARMLRWLGLDGDLTAEVGQSDIAYQNTGESQVLDLIAQVQRVEGGAFFAGGDGRLIFHSREHRWNQAPAMVLSAADVEPDGFEVTADLQRLVNDVILTSPTGAQARAVNAASVAAYGRHTPDDDNTIHATTDDALQDVADWTVHRYGEPAARVTSVTVNLLTHDEAFAEMILTREIGDRIQITGLPDQAPTATLDLVIEGMSDSIRHDEWLVTIHTSPASADAILTLDSDEFTLGTSVLGY